MDSRQRDQIRDQTLLTIADMALQRSREVVRCEGNVVRAESEDKRRHRRVQIHLTAGPVKTAMAHAADDVRAVLKGRAVKKSNVCTGIVRRLRVATVL